MSAAAARTVFLFDVDNTLLDNDRVITDLERHLAAEIGAESAQRYWKGFESLRKELGYADYLGALQRYRIDHPHDLKLMAVSYFLLRYPFANRLYPNSLDAVEHVKPWGPISIFSDGDVVFQPNKVFRSGLRELFEGNVLIYVHKEKELKDTEERFPAEHYVLVDDKIRILTAVKKAWKSRVTTVFVNQGHYALDPANAKKYPAADVSLERIGELVNYTEAQLLAASKS
jgi:FMN phosphatase YigB (HAD superfamily)